MTILTTLIVAVAVSAICYCHGYSDGKKSNDALSDYRIRIRDEAIVRLQDQVKMLRRRFSEQFRKQGRLPLP